MDTTEQIQQALFNYVKENTFKDISNLTSDTMIFIEGILDSMGFALLLDFLEERFKITPADSDLVETNFESIDAMTEFVEKKQSTIA